VPVIQQRINDTIGELIEKGVVFFGSGAALGFDLMAAAAVIRHREANQNVKLIMVLPCRNQEVRWKPEDQAEYRRMLDAADKTVCLSERYYDGCMSTRNKHLVENSSVCVAYMTHGRSGTSQTVRYAKERNLAVINLAEKYGKGDA
jgi:uncharacterized phage-like protein YoqJ